MHAPTQTSFLQLLMLSTLCLGVLPAHAEEIERTMALVEVRAGEDPNTLTNDYLLEIATGVQKEAVADVMLVPMAKSAEKLRRDRDQIPGGLSVEQRKNLESLRKQGIGYLDNADAQNAIKLLQQAEAKYRAAIASPGADDKLRKDYLDVLAQLATAHVVAHDKDAASEVFRTVVTAFGPKANVTDDFYRPDVVELFRKVAKEATAQPKGGMEVTSDPPGAHVLLNGIDRGVTPATIGDLAPGVYAVRLLAGAASSMLHRVKVTGGAKAKLNVAVEYERHLILDENHVGLAYADLDTAQKRVLADSVALGKELGVLTIAAVGVLDGTLYAWLIDVGQGRIERSSSVKVPGIGTSPRAVAKVLGTLLGEHRKDEVAAGEGAEKPKSGGWYTSVPGIVCGVAALAALGVGFAYMPNDFVTEAPDQAAKDKAQTGRVISGVGLGAGAALAGVAAFFFWREANSAPPAAAASLPPPQFGLASTYFAASH